jgi:hypothetical protein
LVGIEPHPTDPAIDICTYSCGTCEEVSTQLADRQESDAAE